MRVLELFCGKKGWSKAFSDRGHDVVTLDIDQRFAPTICADILTVNPDDLEGPFDVILASPPCECFSVASISTHWTGGIRVYQPKTERAVKAIKILEKTVELVRALRPKIGWVLENPRGVMRKMAVLQGIHRDTVTYCQYGDTRMKPTDLWGDFPHSFTPKPVCRNGDPCHERAPRGAKTGTQGIKGYADRSLIPYELSLAFCLAFEQPKGAVMKMEYVEKPQKDFKGDHLCDSCWNGRHYVPELKRVRCAYHKAHLAEDDTKCQRCKWKMSGKTLLNCKGGKCECMCRELEAEKAAKPKKQKGSDPSQTSFTEMITIGHVDSN